MSVPPFRASRAFAREVGRQREAAERCWRSGHWAPNIPQRGARAQAQRPSSGSDGPDESDYFTSTSMRIHGWMQHWKRCFPFERPVTSRRLPWVTRVLATATLEKPPAHSGTVGSPWFRGSTNPPAELRHLSESVGLSALVDHGSPWPPASTVSWSGSKSQPGIRGSLAGLVDQIARRGREAERAERDLRGRGRSRPAPAHPCASGR